ncbi:MAG: T9SS type A sorting domain-containing protein [Saprospiraceae bacterium]|nr:T9SS type A sorting domain-containing protein [Saprospiraceae bacterium]
MELAKLLSHVARNCCVADGQLYVKMMRATANKGNFLGKQKWSKLLLLYVLLIFGRSAMAQHCSHPAVTAGLASVPASNVNFTTQTGFIDFDNDGVQDLADGDGSYLYVNNGCSTPYNFTVNSGGFYGIIKERGVSYTVDICYSNTTYPRPTIDVWNTRADGSPLLATSTEIVLNATTNCARVTLNDCMQNVFMSVYSHDCLSDWRPWTLNVTCTPCVLTCPASIVNLSTQGNDCDVDVANLPLPTYCKALSWSYTITNNATGIVFDTEDGLTGTTYPVLDLPIGIYTVDLTADDPCAALGTHECSYTVVVRPPIYCNDLINIGLPDNCTIDITPDAVLEDMCNDTNTDYVGYEVTIGTTSSSIITNGHAGEIYDYTARVFQDLDNDGIRDAGELVYNSCTGQIALQDFLAPQVICADATVMCGQATDIGSIAAPTATDNCSGINSSRTSYYDVVTPGDGCSDADADGFGVTSTIRRTWTFYDNSGNSSSCTQTITVRRPLLGIYAGQTTSIIFPSNRDDVAGLLTSITGVGTNVNGTADDALNCATIVNGTNGPIIPASIAGQPKIWIDYPPLTTATTKIPGAEDTVIDITVACMFGASPVDQVIEACGSTHKLIRVWTVMDWCNTNSVQVHSNINSPQIIKIADVIAPTMSTIAPSSVIITPNSNYSCGANITLPPTVVTDNCNTTTVRISNPTLGTLNSNGGVFTNVPAGTYVFTYTATDACNNVSTQTVTVTVADNLEPIAVCEQDFVVSLTSAGTAIAYAQTFDDGSFDNCSATLTMSVKRNDVPGSTFGPFVSFNCSDVGEIIPVTLLVSDGILTNQCTVNVTVQDPFTPAFTYVPADITVNVGTDITNTTNTNGIATASDNCTNLTITYQDNGSVNNCGVGVITRSWRAFDGSNYIVRTQTITVSNLTPFSSINVVFPADVTIECGSTTDTGTPLVTGGVSGMIAVGYNDDTLTVVGSNHCRKILRDWTVIDWCQYNPSNPSIGRVTHEQIIVLNDNVSPVFTSFPDNITVNANAACQAVVTLPNAIATDACSGNTVNVSVSVPNTLVGLGTGYGPYTAPIGTYRIVYTASDGCGNVATRDLLLIVKDGTAPIFVCNSITSLPLPASDLLSVSASTFVQTGSTSESCSLPVTYTGRRYNTLQPELNAGVPFTSQIGFNCEAASCGIVSVEIKVCDAANNCNTCIVPVQILDNDGTCAGVPCTLVAPRPAGLIQGAIQNESGLKLSGATVHFMHEDEAMPNTTTDANGTFTISGLEVGENYMVQPEKNDDPLNGVTTLDLVLISKHILGLQQITNPYRLVAADINNSGTITTIDMVELRRLILNLIPTFTNNSSWRFVRSDYSVTLQNALSGSLPNQLETYPFSADVTNADFVPVKVGDINGSAIYDSNFHSSSSQNRNEKDALTFVLNDALYKANTEIRIPVTATDFKNITGFQYTMSINSSALSFREVIPGRLTDYNEMNFGNFSKAEGLLTTSWHSATPMSYNENDVLFTLVFDAKKDITLSNEVSLSAKLTPSEAYVEDENEVDNTSIIDVAWAFRQGENQVLTLASAELFQNKPNPFKDETSISFWLPNASNSKLIIYDATGKVVKEVVGEYSKGYHEVKIAKSELANASGILYYQLETDSKTITKKMIAIE